MVSKECNFDLYRPVWAVCTSPPDYQYADRPLPGGTAKSTIGDRLREKSTVRSNEGEKGKKKKKRKRRKKKKRRRRKKYLLSPRCPPPSAVTARG
ncbi:hypothetical protein BHE74_00018136 [Ensete ventricosum]|nr:hypothetical protein BHE74_00018136 [Ensete ventricosum]